MAGKKRSKIAIARGVCIGVIFAIGVASAIFHTGTGNYSSFGIGYIASICPLGALEALFGRFAFVPRILIALAAVVLLTMVVGKAFCSWVCPVPPLRSFFSGKRAKRQDAEERALAAKAARTCYVEGASPERHAVDSRHLVLCGALGTTAIFGFPVFCLVCPLGLTFAIVVGLVRLIGYNEPSVTLLIAAAVLVLELVFLRKWCAKICPVGALLSLISRANKTFRPTVDTGKCLRCTSGDTCGACAAACPEQIDPQANLGAAPVFECTKCGKCADACPASAISFPLFVAKVKEFAPKK